MPRNTDGLKSFRTSEAARIAGAKGGSSPKKRATIDAKKLMRSILSSKPILQDKQRSSLENLGIDLEDDKLTTNAAVISAVITARALKGDLQAIKLALEMGGQPVDGRALIELEKLKLEREKFELQKLIALRTMKPPEDIENSSVDAFIQALERAGAAVTLDKCDTPEDTGNSSQSAENADMSE